MYYKLDPVRVHSVLRCMYAMTPSGASSQGLLPDRGGISGIILSISERERSSPLPFRAKLYYLFEFRIKERWVVGSLENVYLEGKCDTRIWEQGMLTCPGVSTLVQSPALSPDTVIVEAPN